MLYKDKVKFLIIIIIMLFLFSSFLHAQQFQLSINNISFQKTGTEGSLGLYMVDYPGDVPVTVLSSRQPGDYEKNIIKKFTEDIFNWNFITLKAVKIFFWDDHIEINIIPQKLVYNNRDYTQYMPAGLSFFHTDYTVYDFRLLVDNFFIRMRGQYYDPGQMLERMESAVDDPVRYIAAHDPEYIIKQIADINLEAVTAKGEINKLRQDLEKLSAMFENLAEKHDALSAMHRDLEDKHEYLIYSYIGEIRNGFFGKKQPVPQEHIDAVLEIKRNNPAASVDEVYSSVKEQGIKLSKGKVTIILNAYLGFY